MSKLVKFSSGDVINEDVIKLIRPSFIVATNEELEVLAGFSAPKDGAEINKKNTISISVDWVATIISGEEEAEEITVGKNFRSIASYSEPLGAYIKANSSKLELDKDDLDNILKHFHAIRSLHKRIHALTDISIPSVDDINELKDNELTSNGDKGAEEPTVEDLQQSLDKRVSRFNGYLTSSPADGSGWGVLTSSESKPIIGVFELQAYLAENHPTVVIDDMGFEDLMSLPILP